MQLTRYSAPTKMDIAPYLSICKVGNGKDTVELYVQRSYDDMEPRWEFIADIPSDLDAEDIQEIIEIKLQL